MLEIFDINYKYSIVLAYIASVIFHFIANKFFTFRNDENFSLNQIIRYSSMIFLNLLITYLVVFFSHQIFDVSVYLSTVLSITSTIFFTYLISKNWVFRRNG